jgi:hypothetical protein
MSNKTADFRAFAPGEPVLAGDVPATVAFAAHGLVYVHTAQGLRALEPKHIAKAEFDPRGGATSPLRPSRRPLTRLAA